MGEMAQVPGSTRDSDRAGALVVVGSEVALIERHRDGVHYWVAPGGGVEHGESAAAAATREALEELGLDILIQRKVLEIRGLHPRGRVQHYFLATATERAFGDMTGPEKTTASNTYAPRWVDLREVVTMNVLPLQLREFLAEIARVGWSDDLMIMDAT